VGYHVAIVDYVRRCPGSYFRELARELQIPVGTLQYWLGRLTARGELYVLKLMQRPRYFHFSVSREEAEAVYLVREIRLSPSLAPRLAVDIKPELIKAVVERYPCVRQDLVDAFINLFSQL